jgi:succinate dehydrogenase/fumarate reductase flavoprotein subunit
MALAGGAAGFAAMAAMGVAARRGECSVNPPDLDVAKMKTAHSDCDLLVVGSGIAGLFAAVKGHDAGARVLMVSKGRLGASGQTPFAKGIFAFDPAQEKLSLDEFVDRVSRSALGTNNPVFTRQMAAHSLDRVRELESWGFFDSPLYADAFNRPIKERGIPVMERIMITHLIKDKGRIAGAAGFSIDAPTVHIFTAKSVVLCSGAGGFKPNGFPICDLTHDGTVMAYRIGAKVTGKEWNDGHPGQATNAAACYDGWHGMFDRKPGRTEIGIRHDLGVDLNYQAYMGGSPLAGGPPGSNRGEQVSGGPYRPAGFEDRWGPGGPPGGDGPEGRPPRGGAPGKGAPPPGMGRSPVGGSSAGMSIHKSEGLVPINADGASTVPGLYAAGDALGSYMAGAIYTQIGSSLAGSAVQGGIAAEAAAAYARGQAAPTIPVRQRLAVREEILAPLKRERGYGPAWVTQTLQGIMIPNFVLYIKKASLMKAALAYVEELRDHHLPMLRAADLHELRLAHETANMIVNAEMKLRASIMRTESRCSHFRLDYPEPDTQNWNAWINIYQGRDGSMQLEKQAFGSWPS